MKKQIISFLLLLIISGVSSSSFADGKIYWREDIPPAISFQRALLMYDAGRETLIVQSKYQLPRVHPDASFGWVVPVPAVPDMASMDATSADFLFSNLSIISRPSYIQVRIFIFALLFVSGVIALVLGVLARFLAILRALKKHTKNLVRYGMCALLIGFFSFVVSPTLSGKEEQPVEVVKAEKVGIYEVRVVKSEEATALIAWLKENNFHFDESDTQVFEDYIRKKWCFVTAKIEQGAAHKAQEEFSGGLVAPLILRFKTDQAVYPLALTSLTGHDTKVLLYVLNRSKVECDRRMELHYADTTDLLESEEMEWLRSWPDPQNFFMEKERVLPYLTAFEATMTSAEMKEDLIFRVAKDNQPFRKQEIRW